MKPAKLTLVALLATAPAAFGQSITRVVVDHQIDSDVTTFAPTVASTLGHHGKSVNVGSCAACAPPLAEVRLIAISVSGSLDMGTDGEFIMLSPNGTHMGAFGSEGGYSCGGACYWGPFDSFGGQWMESSSSTVALALGDPWSLNGGVSMSSAVAYSPTSPPAMGWQFLVQGAYVETGGSFGAEWEALPFSGPSVPTDVLMLSHSIWAIAEQTVTATFELDATAMTNYCTSQANGLNVHGALDAYGSPEPTISGEWLTIRTRDVPEGSAGILFMGTDIVVVPGGTTTLCVGGNIQRVGGVQVVNGGFADFEVSLAGFLPGDTARFQCFHRDPVVGVAATDAFVLTVQ